MRRFWLPSLVLLLLACACSGPQQGTQTGDEGDVSTPGVSCAPACGGAQNCCAMECVDTSTDPQACGRCGNTCPVDSYCAAGKCVTLACTASCASDAPCCGSACCGATQACCAGSTGPVCGSLTCTAP